MRILIVEDEALVLMQLEMLLEGCWTYGGRHGDDC